MWYEWAGSLLCGRRPQEQNLASHSSPPSTSPVREYQCGYGAQVVHLRVQSSECSTLFDEFSRKRMSPFFTVSSLAVFLV